MQQDDRFVDREREVRALQLLAERETPGLALVYGRRRVGKTYLLDHAWPARRVFYYLASGATGELNRRELLRDLALWLGRELDPADYPTWRTVFRLFGDLAMDAPLIVVLDEFQYLLDRDDAIASQLAAVWDRELRGRPLTLALCGSEVGTMARLQEGSQPLFGRFGVALRVLPFDPYDTWRMLPERPLREAAYLYGALGGLPRYLAAVAPGESLAGALTRIMLAPSGEVHVQIEHLIEQEQGIRDPAPYRATLAAVAAGRTLIPAITDVTGLGEFEVRRVLGVLEGLELIWRERNFAAPTRAPYRHRLADNAVRFWYHFVNANRSRLATGDPAEVWVGRVAPHLDTYMGRVFERICQAAFGRFGRRWGLPGAIEWARWEGQDRNRRPIEIDLVARLDDGRLLTGEIKWSSAPIEAEVHRDLRRDLEDLANSGQGWAREALDPQRSAGHLYCSAAGFSAGFRALAAADPRLHLITLEGLYGQDAPAAP